MPNKNSKVPPAGRAGKIQKSKLQLKSQNLVKEEVQEKIANQVFKGRVVSVKTAKTATVLIESRKTHPLYKKSYIQSKRYLVADDLGVKPGDLVNIVKCKPVSKNKHFKIVKVIGRDMEAIVTEQIKEESAAAIEEIIPVETEETKTEEIKEEEKTETKEKPKKKKEKK